MLDKEDDMLECTQYFQSPERACLSFYNFIGKSSRNDNKLIFENNFEADNLGQTNVYCRQEYFTTSDIKRLLIDGRNCSQVLLT